MSKVCRRCGEHKPVADFNSHATTRDRLRSWCRECERVSAKAWHVANHERSRENQREANRRRDDGTNAKWAAIARRTAEELDK